MSNDFFNMTHTDDFSMVHHNQTDYSSFKAFQETIDSQFETLEKNRSIKERRANVMKWDDTLPKRWKSARLKTIDNESVPVIMGMIKEKGLTNFFLRGEPGVGKTYISFAIVRQFIGMGLITPSQVKIISEENLLNIPKLGFSGQDRFDKLLNRDLKFYIFDNVGSREVYDKREAPLWEQLIDHIYTEDLNAIFTSNGSAASFSHKLSTPAGSKFGNLVEGNIVEIKGKPSWQLDDWTDEEMAEHEKMQEEVKKFDNFGNRRRKP